MFPGDLIGRIRFQFILNTYSVEKQFFEQTKNQMTHKQNVDLDIYAYSVACRIFYTPTLHIGINVFSLQTVKLFIQLYDPIQLEEIIMFHGF